MMAAAKKETDNYVSEYDWIQIREKMEAGMVPETFLGKFSRKFGENPLVPIGNIALIFQITALIDCVCS
jgi:hypothetical protein